jgi:uncharacterized protein YbcI
LGRQGERTAGGTLLEAVSNLVVGIYANHVGRGPTKARSYVSGDIVVCLMEDTMTRAERTLVESGRGEAVAEIRAALRETMRREMMEGVERLMGRRVVALNSGGNLEPDVMSELFLLGEDCEAPSGNGRRLTAKPDRLDATARGSRVTLSRD